MKKNKKTENRKSKDKDTKMEADIQTIDKVIAYGLYSLFLGILLFGLYSMTDPEWMSKLNRENKKRETRATVYKGIALSQKGKDLEAIEFYKEAIDILPEFTEANINMALSLMRLKRYDEAIRLLKNTLKHKSLLHYRIYDQLVDLYNVTQDEQNKEACFKKSMELNPFVIEKLMKKGIYYFNQSNWDKAMPAFQKALSKRRKMSSYYKDMLQSAKLRYVENSQKLPIVNELIEKGIDEDALSVYDTTMFKKFLNIDKSYAENYNKIGYIYAKQSDYRKAIEYFKKAINIWPQYSDAINNIKYVNNKLRNEAKSEK